MFIWLIHTHSRSKYVTAFSWSWFALMHKIVSWKGGSCTAHVKIPWHAPDLCLFRWRLCSGGRGCRRSILLHHGKFICHTYLLNGHPSQDCWKLYMMMHDDAWWCMILHDIISLKNVQTPRFAHTPSMLYTWGYQTLDFTFNWEDQQWYYYDLLCNILHVLLLFYCFLFREYICPTPIPIKLYIHWRSSIRV